MIISCSNCGMGKGLDKCLAEALGYEYRGAYQCPYFTPIDIGEKEKSADNLGSGQSRKEVQEL